MTDVRSIMTTLLLTNIYPLGYDAEDQIFEILKQAICHPEQRCDAGVKEMEPFKNLDGNTVLASLPDGGE